MGPLLFYQRSTVMDSVAHNSSDKFTTPRTPTQTSIGYSPRSEAAIDGRVERADDEQGEEEVKGARDEVVVAVFGLVDDVDLAEVAVFEVLERLELGREEDGADKGRADGRQQD